jgi:hypothetical protein
MLLRAAYLNFSSMRIVISMFGSLMIIRAILGPAFVVKMAFTLRILFDFRFQTREAIGIEYNFLLV